MDSRSNKARQCGVKGCLRRRRASGLCPAHQKMADQGIVPDGPIISNIERLRRFADEAAAAQTDHCVLWNGPLDPGGYPAMGPFKGHRVVCEKAHGPPPFKRAHAAHSCGRRSCMNPRHLRWATAKENHGDRIGHGTDPIGERNPNARIGEDAAQSIMADPRGSAAIAADHGISQGAVARIKSGAAWGHVHGTRVWGAGSRAKKLDEPSVRAIRADHRAQRVIANDYGVSQMTVSLVKRRLVFAGLE